MTAVAYTLEVPDRGGRLQTASLQDLDAVAVAISAPSGSNTTMEIQNDGNVVVAFISTDTVARTVVVKAQPNSYGLGGSGVGDVSFTIPVASATTPQMAFVPFMNPKLFNNIQTVQLTISDETTASSLKAAVIHLVKKR